MFKRMLLLMSIIFIAYPVVDHNQLGLSAEPIRERMQIEAALENLQIPFVENVGQFDERVRFCTRTFAGDVFVTGCGEIVYNLSSSNLSSRAPGVVLTETLVDARVDHITGEIPAEPTVSYFRGSDESKWRRDVGVFEQVGIEDIYDGISLKLKAYGGNVEKLLYVNPGADPEDIRIKISGGSDLRTNRTGGLDVQTDLGVVSFTNPVAYQEIAGARVYIDVAYCVSDNEYGFEVGEYDNMSTLVIDPLLASTYLGGSARDGMYEVPSVLDGEGNIYVASITWSQDLLTTDGVYDDSLDGYADVFVAKLDAGLTTLLACTYLGGSSTDGEWPGVAMTLGDDGSVYVSGKTYSSDFPYTSEAYDTTYDGQWDIFISRLDADLTTLLASTYLGGTGEERYVQMTTDPIGNICVAGATASLDFPFTEGAYDSTYNPGGNLKFDIFVSKFGADLDTLIASTFLGSSGDECNEVVLSDEEGNIYVTGWTSSSSFPTSLYAFDRTFNFGYWDAYVSKLGRDLDTLLASTFLGGNKWDFGYGMTIDAEGNVYIGGHTASDTLAGFPITPGAYDSTYNGVGIQGVDDDAFISKFDSDLTTLIASTYLGGTQWEIITGIVADEFGYVYVSGNTNSDDFPYTPGTVDSIYGGGTGHAGDAIVSRFNANLSELSFSTYIGGANNEITGSISLDVDGNLYVAGGTGSEDFPTTIGAYNEDFNGGPYEWGGDVFLSIIPEGYWTDTDEDGILDANDNCPVIINPNQEDADEDMVGDSCDNCIDVPNPDQGDDDSDGIGNACEYVCGDADSSGGVDIDDVVFIISYIFGGGESPDPLESADADCVGGVDIDDVVYLITYIFAGGNAPCDPDGSGIPDC